MLSLLTTCATLVTFIAAQWTLGRICSRMCSHTTMTCSSSPMDGFEPRTSQHSFRNCQNWMQWRTFPKTPSPRQTRLLLPPTLQMVVEMTMSSGISRVVSLTKILPSLENPRSKTTMVTLSVGVASAPRVVVGVTTTTTTTKSSWKRTASGKKLRRRRTMDRSFF